MIGQIFVLLGINALLSAYFLLGRSQGHAECSVVPGGANKGYLGGSITFVVGIVFFVIGMATMIS